MAVFQWFTYLLPRNLPTGQDLEQLADELGVSRFGLKVSVGAAQRLDEAELQRRVIEA
jgi:hypothetical protein